MSEAAAEDRSDSRDEELLAELFDQLLQEILEGRTPDLTELHRDRPDLQPRIQKAWSLACAVAGRREPSRPVMGGYEIVRELGHGGMGTVYLARHQILQREVAIKVLPQSLAMSARAKQRFLAEARALAQVRHDDVVHIHRVLDHAEMLAFEMEYISGPSLQEVVQTLRAHPKPGSRDALAAAVGVPASQLGARTTVEWAVRLGIRMARALAAVHTLGLVHRDVKPANILLRDDGRPVLADFGLAHAGGETDAGNPRATSFAGTAGYAAPERLRSGDAGLDARADIYGLGVTLCELLLLRAPYRGQSGEEVLRQIDRGEFTGVREHAPHVSRDLDIVIGKAMQADPRHRYGDANAFADDLQRVLDFAPILARPDGPLQRLGKLLRRNRTVVLAASAGALLVVLALLPWLDHLRSQEQRRAAAGEALLAARSLVLSPDNLRATDTRATAGTPADESSDVLASQGKALAAALTQYDLVLATPPTTGTAAVERHVVALVRCALAGAPTPGELAERLAALPPLTRHVAGRLLGRPTAPEPAVATPLDRFGAGLVALLLGSPQQARAAWQDLSTELPDHPLLDAGSALLLAHEGHPERAFPRLFHAAKAFPSSSALALALAEAALVMGDLELAATWLDRSPDPRDQPFAQRRRELLAADLDAARGNRAAAAAVYRRLVHADAGDPLPVLRLAELASHDGDWQTATRQLEHLLRRWPHHSAARLELARIHLLRRDLPAYLAEARFVLGLELDEFGPGACERFAAILSLAGLDDLRSGRLAQAAIRSGPTLRNQPLSTWLPAAAQRGVRHALTTLATFDRLLRRFSDRDARRIPAGVHAARLTLLQLPSLTWQGGPWLGVLVLLAPGRQLDQLANHVAEQAALRGSSLGSPLQVVTNHPFVRAERTIRRVGAGTPMLRTRDLDGDTLPEFVLAWPTQPGEPERGALELRSLHTGELLRTFVADDDLQMFARAVLAVPDVDGDFCDELLVGAPRGTTASRGGEVVLLSGRTGQRLWSQRSDHDAFGVALAALDDLDGDGHGDFAVGSSPATLLPNDPGRVVVLSARTGRPLREFVAERGGNWFGGALAAAGDLDGDGVGDLLVGGNYGNAPGLVRALSVATGRELFSLTEPDRSTDFGEQLVALGDLDGDGRSEFAIAAAGRSSRGLQPGRVAVLDGTGRIRHELFGERAGDGFGAVLCVVPDWRRDGRPALAVAARRGGVVGSGYVRVFDAGSGRPLQSFFGMAGHAAYGFAMCDLGDRDGDGFPDLGIAEAERGGRVHVRSMSFALHPQVAEGR
jgi:serine/threonine protein kinase